MTRRLGPCVAAVVGGGSGSWSEPSPIFCSESTWIGRSREGLTSARRKRKIGVSFDAPAGRRCHSWGVARSVLIVDDDAGFRLRARRLLSLAGYNVIGEAEDGASALARVSELQPDVVLLDILLPG